VAGAAPAQGAAAATVGAAAVANEVVVDGGGAADRGLHCAGEAGIAANPPLLHHAGKGLRLRTEVVSAAAP